MGNYSWLWNHSLEKLFQDMGDEHICSQEEEGPFEQWFSILAALWEHCENNSCPGHSPIQLNQISGNGPLPGYLLKFQHADKA